MANPSSTSWSSASTSLVVRLIRPHCAVAASKTRSERLQVGERLQRRSRSSRCGTSHQIRSARRCHAMQAAEIRNRITTRVEAEARRGDLMPGRSPPWPAARSQRGGGRQHGRGASIAITRQPSTAPGSRPGRARPASRLAGHSAGGVAARHRRARSPRPATSGVLRVRKTWSGRPCATISRYGSGSAIAHRARPSAATTRPGLDTTIRSASAIVGQAVTVTNVVRRPSKRQKRDRPISDSIDASTDEGGRRIQAHQVTARRGSSGRSRSAGARKPPERSQSALADHRVVATRAGARRSRRPARR